jgi:lactate permease
LFHQLLTPVHDSLLLSFLCATLPIATVLALLGIARRPAWQASAAGLAVALLLAVALWQLPLRLALKSTAAGMVFALWPVMWIVFNSLLLYNVAVRSGRFDAFRRWVLQHLPNDRRIVLVVIGFCFGALLEGIGGFGSPVAITSALLIALGFSPVDAIVYTLMFNTAPVAFGALGTPVTTLGAVTGLPATVLGSMIGRQLPLLAILLPFYVVALYGGFRSVRALWPVLLVAGGSFAAGQFVTSNFISYELTDVAASLLSLLATVAFLRFWQPAPEPAAALAAAPVDLAPAGTVPVWQGWLPWAMVSAVVIAWTTLKLNLIGEMKLPWSGLHNQIHITLYDKPYAAVWTFQPLATGTAILVSSLLTAVCVGIGIRDYLRAIADTWRQVRLAILTVMLIVGLAYLMNYSGMAYTLGLGVASVGFLYPLLSAFLGWLAVFLSGSDTSGNALFGNLQVIAARQLSLNPILMAATNSTGGVMGKMISPQNISTGCATSALKGREGIVFARTFIHSIILTLLLGLLVMLQQYLWPWMIPAIPAH